VTDRLPSRIVSFDFARSISILWVVAVWHVTDYFPAYAYLKSAFAYRVTVAALGVFVLISGFLMGRKAVPAREFYTARMVRIYPPFVLACLAFGVMKLAGWGTVVKAAALIGMVNGPAIYTLWFINMIVLFYAVTPVLMRARGSLIGFSLLCGGLAAALALAALSWSGVSPRLAMYFPCYALGLWLARADRPAPKACLIAGVLVMLPGGALTALLPARLVESSVLSAPWALGGSLAVFGAVQLAERFMAGLRWPRMIAHASYFLYLFHRVAYALMLKLVAHAGDGARLAALLGVALPLAVGLAWWGQTGYDAAWKSLDRRRGLAR